MDLQPAVKMSPFRFIFKVSLIHVDGGATVLQQDPISKTQDSTRTLLFYTALPYLVAARGGPARFAVQVSPSPLTDPVVVS
jgi:hypothetical protein